ncbi:P-loop containing nucleoside triphosphate hydrolase protein, partial [Dunaliella salina]
MTGSGKTYTMSGREEVICQDGYKGDTKDGIVTQSVNYLYRKIKERKDATYTLSASYLEIYNEGVYDLLPAAPGSRTGRRDAHAAGIDGKSGSSGTDSPGTTSMENRETGPRTGQPDHLPPPKTSGGTSKPGTSGPGLVFKPGSMPPAPCKPGTAVPVARDLSIKWEAGQGFHVPGLQVVQCNTIEEMLKVIHSGMQHRHVGSHELNIESSRSHSLMTIHCHALPSDPNAWDQGAARCGKICFVDLAGSERLKDSKSEGTMLKETTNINKSLFVLGKVG